MVTNKKNLLTNKNSIHKENNLNKMNLKKSIIITITYYFAFSLPAYAYLDPGSISIFLQSIIALIAGVGATYRLWIYKFKSLFKKEKKKDTESEKIDR